MTPEELIAPRRSAAEETHPYRMAEVMQLTGSSREAVRFYVNAGLLPKPYRTARNMAWYSAKHIEIIKLIRALQEEQFLPLKAIKALFEDDKGFEFTPRQRSIFASMREEMLGKSRRTLPGPASHALAEAVGLGHADFEDLKKVGAIRGDAERLSSDEEEIVRQFAALRHSGMTASRGFSARHIEIVEAAAELLFTKELQLFQELLVDLRDDEIPVLMARVIPAVNRIFAVYHERRLRAFVAHYAQNGKAALEAPEESKSRAGRLRAASSPKQPSKNSPRRKRGRRSGTR